MGSSTPLDARGAARRPYARLVQLASGGMGIVDVVVRQEGSFQRLYARKTLREAYREDADIRAMFLAEARIAGLIHHPNVVSVLDVGESEADGPYLIMEYVDGVTARALFDAARARREHLPLGVVLEVLESAARGLHAAHETRDLDGSEVNVVHRDVSPHNVLLGFDGTVRVTDFGVAKVLGHLSQTDTGVLKGKMGYMSPEQLRFEAIDRRSDLFALGVVLYELTTLTRLYRSRDGLPAANQILHEPPPDLGELRSDLPAELVALSFRLLAKRPEQRPATAAEVAEALRRIRGRLDAEDEPSLVEQLGAWFGAEHAARADELAEALAHRRIAAPEPHRESARAGEAGTRVEGPAANARGRRGALVFGGVLASVIVAAAAWIAFDLGSTDRDASVDPTTAPAAAPRTEPIEPTHGEAQAAVTEPPAPPLEPPADGVGDAPPEHGEATEPIERPPRRRSRSSRRRPTEEPRGAPSNDIWTEFP